MDKIQFSVLSYYPNFLNNENIAMGILFCTDDRIEFRITKNWNRVKVFDDQIDLPFIRKYLEGIKIECEEWNLHQTKSFSLKEYIKFYVNKFRFNKIISSNANEVDFFMKETEKFYLRYDFKKNERMCKEDEIRYIKNLMKFNNIKFSTKKIVGDFEEAIKFDYVIGTYGFKNFSFENKNIKRQIMNAKAWSYTASKTTDYKTIFIYDKEQPNSDEYRIIMKILKDNSYKVITKDEAFSFIKTINSDKMYRNELF